MFGRARVRLYLVTTFWGDIRNLTAIFSRHVLGRYQKASLNHHIFGRYQTWFHLIQRLSRFLRLSDLAHNYVLGIYLMLEYHFHSFVSRQISFSYERIYFLSSYCLFSIVSLNACLFQPKDSDLSLRAVILAQAVVPCNNCLIN